MVSFGILPALASLIALRKRAFASGSPPPLRAATVISLMNLVNSLPRLASSAPFLCLILCHFECPDIGVRSFWECGLSGKAIYQRPRNYLNASITPKAFANLTLGLTTPGNQELKGDKP